MTRYPESRKRRKILLTRFYRNDLSICFGGSLCLIINQFDINRRQYRCQINDHVKEKKSEMIVIDT